MRDPDTWTPSNPALRSVIGSTDSVDIGESAYTTFPETP